MRAIQRRQEKSADWQERRALRNEFRLLRKELKVREKKAVGEVMAGARLVLATLTGCADRMLRDTEPFDVVVIDEAAQAMEPACWIAMLKGRRVVLAGDHMQLPPTITSVAAAKAGLGKTLLDRVVAMFGDSATRMLQVQYRMHEAIMGFSSHELYTDKLVADESVRHHLLRDLERVKARAAGGNGGSDDDECVQVPLLFVDTAGCHLDESQEEAGASRENQGEALLVVEHVHKLIDCGVPPSEVAVITPYNAQVKIHSFPLPSVQKTLPSHDRLV
jgi:ATP-dependent RNA/DNA helicase IGHMBP2